MMGLRKGTEREMRGSEIEKFSLKPSFFVWCAECEEEVKKDKRRHTKKVNGFEDWNLCSSMGF